MGLQFSPKLSCEVAAHLAACASSSTRHHHGLWGGVKRCAFVQARMALLTWRATMTLMHDV
jgi:hypothetical protein